MGKVSRFYANEDHCQYGEDLYELSVIPMGCTLNRRIDNKEFLIEETTAWNDDRNENAKLLTGNLRQKMHV